MGKLVLPSRSEKPRPRGLTAMIDFGPDTFGWTGEAGVRDLLECAGPYIDFAKIYALNALLLPPEPLKRIVRLYRDHDVMPYAGGILFEYAYRNNAVEELPGHLAALGIGALEISENYVALPETERRRQVDRFRKHRFEVIYEFGRKQPDRPFDPAELEARVTDMREAGVKHIIVEQSEIDELAKADASALTSLVRTNWFQDLLIEVDPYRFPQQHAQILRELGPETNLANVTAGQCLRLEGLRRGIGRAVNYSILAAEAVT